MPQEQWQESVLLKMKMLNVPVTNSLLLKDKLSGERVKLVMEHIWKLQEFCNSMAKLETDGYEYAYLKAIVLFSPGKHTLPTHAKVLHWLFSRNSQMFGFSNSKMH